MTPARPLVLAYHSVAPHMEARLLPSMVTLTDELADHVGQLRALGRRIVTAGELAAELGGGASGEDAAVLTFDDGWADALSVAAPLLRELGVRATFFLCPGLFGNPEPAMSFAGRVLTHEEAGLLHEAGMELGAHSMHHPDLTAVDEATLAAELTGSRAAIEAITTAPCRVLAYPFGAQDERVRRAAAAAGYELAFTFSDGPWEPFAAPRLPMPAAGEPWIAGAAAG